MAEKNTVVRGPDKDVLSKTAPPTKLTEQQAQQLTEILLQTLSKNLKTFSIKRFQLTSRQDASTPIQITIPDVLME